MAFAEAAKWLFSNQAKSLTCRLISAITTIHAQQVAKAIQVQGPM
jgi:hypothetical protein